jgi:AcrR family transcriptional regulator
MTEARRAAPGSGTRARVITAPRTSPASGTSPARGTSRARGSSPARGTPPRQPKEAHGRPDTRQRIQSVALELFAEQGYDKTSLREIAERLDVTKAALYYHFKSKEDIVTSLVEDYFGQIDELIAWGRTQPRTPQFRAEFLTRYFGVVNNAGEVFRMLQGNQASVNSLAHAKNRSELFRERMDRLVDLLTEPDAPMPSHVRAAMALVSVSFGCMFYGDRFDDPDVLRDTVLDIAFELTGAQQ